MTEDSDFQFGKISLFLEENNKNRRKQGLESVKNLLIQNYKKEEKILKLWEIFHKPLVRILNDQLEACRELAVDILKEFISLLPVQEKNIVYLIPILARRLGSQELLETSEEIRLNCISFIRVLMNKYNNCLNPYFEDLATILARTVTDNYPNVKQESCQAISELAKILPQSFYIHSESFVKGVLGNFMHQHYRVRVASVYTIGNILQYGKSIIMEQVATPMAQRLFDQSSAVRIAVIKVAGNWLIHLRDKYSWWYKLIPLILTGLHDEIQEIRETAAKLWDAAGLKYLEENESDIKVKDQMDYLIEKPKHYPENTLLVQRPNLGCRIIVQQNFGKLVNGIIAELDDWLPDVKVRSAQLLCVLIFNAEQDVTMNIEKLLLAMARACNDEDIRVAENVELAAKYMGYFIPPKTYCPLILLSMQENPTSGYLRVFASILSGSERTNLEPELKEIGNFIQENYMHSSNLKYQTEMLHCCGSLIFVCKEACSGITEQLFKSIFSIMAMAKTNMIKTNAMSLLNELVVIEKLEDLNHLYMKYITNVLNEIQKSCESWIAYSSEFKIFQACISDAWYTVMSNLDFIIPVLEKTTNSSADAEVRLKQYILLSLYLTNQQKIFTDQPVETVIKFINAILEKIIHQGLIWSAGLSAEAIRTASVCCLCALLEKILNMSESNNGEMVEDLSIFINDFNAFFDKTVPVLITLMDDNAVKTRFYSLKAICQVVIIGRKVKCLNAEYIHKIYPVLLKRLDDGSDSVRHGSIEALQEIWMKLPEDYDLQFYSVHIDMVYTTAIIHLDDPETEFQELMLDAMKKLGKVHPGLLMQKIEKCRYNFRNQQGLNRLLDCVKSYLSQK